MSTKNRRLPIHDRRNPRHSCGRLTTQAIAGLNQDYEEGRMAGQNDVTEWKRKRRL